MPAKKKTTKKAPKKAARPVNIFKEAAKDLRYKKAKAAAKKAAAKASKIYKEKVKAIRGIKNKKRKK